MTAKPAAKKAAKKAIPPAAAAPRKRAVPALRPAAPPEPAAETPAEQATPQGPPGPVTITFFNRTFPVIRPNDEQMALLLDIHNWARKLKVIQSDLANLPDDAPQDHPEVIKGQKAVEQALRRIGRMNTIVETLIPPDDWEAIQDGMAERRVPWQDFANMPYLILAAHNEAGEMVETNRAARRQQQGRRAR